MRNLSIYNIVPTYSVHLCSSIQAAQYLATLKPPNTLNTVVVRILPVKSSEFEYDGTEIKVRDNTIGVKIDPGTVEGLKEGQTIVLQRSHIDAESEMLHAMPGDFSATNRDGDSVQLETFGAFEQTARWSEAGFCPD